MTDYEQYWLKECQNTATYLLKSYNSQMNERILFTIEKRLLACLTYIRQNSKYYLSNNRHYPSTINIVSYPIRDITAKQEKIGCQYEMFKGKKQSIKIYDICNMFIHINIKGDFVVAEKYYGIYIFLMIKK